MVDEMTSKEIIINATYFCDKTEKCLFHIFNVAQSRRLEKVVVDQIAIWKIKKLMKFHTNKQRSLEHPKTKNDFLTKLKTIKSLCDNIKEAESLQELIAV